MSDTERKVEITDRLKSIVLHVLENLSTNDLTWCDTCKAKHQNKAAVMRLHFQIGNARLSGNFCKSHAASFENLPNSTSFTIGDQKAWVEHIELYQAVDVRMVERIKKELRTEHLQPETDGTR